MDIVPKQFVKSTPSNDSLLPSNRTEAARDDDDPLSIEGASINIIGIILAIMTVFLPAISIFLERPLLQKNEVISNQTFKKDGY